MLIAFPDLSRGILDEICFQQSPVATLTGFVPVILLAAFAAKAQYDSTGKLKKLPGTADFINIFFC
jgi:hypothetical protein